MNRKRSDIRDLQLNCISRHALVSDRGQGKAVKLDTLTTSGFGHHNGIHFELQHFSHPPITVTMLFSYSPLAHDLLVPSYPLPYGEQMRFRAHGIYDALGMHGKYSLPSSTVDHPKAVYCKRVVCVC